ncbi:MAG: TldD/PmbA family protein, partial [Chloroflexi bacterium]|nr:TldD/PmbA family protein [Chloroflexota bacterium]
MKEWTDRALDTAQARGATYADVRIVHRQTQSIVVKNGKVEALAHNESRGFGVRVIAHGAWGFASSSLLEPAELDRVAALAVAIAQASATVPVPAIDLGPSLKIVDKYRTPVQKDPFAVPLEERIALLLHASQAMHGVKGVAVAE